MRGAIDSRCKTAANTLNKQPSKPYVETLINKLELMVVNPVSDSLTKAELYMYYWYTAVID